MATDHAAFRKGQPRKRDDVVAEMVARLGDQRAWLLMRGKDLEPMLWPRLDSARTDATSMTRPLHRSAEPILASGFRGCHDAGQLQPAPPRANSPAEQ